jgi:hypothetical protein
MRGSKRQDFSRGEAFAVRILAKWVVYLANASPKQGDFYD